MRRSFQLVALVTVALLFAVPAHAQSVDEIIAKNLQAKGGLELLRQTATVKMSGTFKTFQPSETAMPMTTWAKRPNMLRREVEVQPPADQGRPAAPSKPVRMVNGSDGTTSWTQQGSAPAHVLPAAQGAVGPVDSEFDGVFIDYRAKGVTINLVGVETLNGKQVYHLSVQRKNAPVQQYFLDKETALEVKVSAEPSQGPSRAKVDTELSDYRTVDGRVVPFRMRQFVNGALAAEMVFDRVEFNVPMPDTLFKIPK